MIPVRRNSKADLRRAILSTFVALAILLPVASTSQENGPTGHFASQATVQTGNTDDKTSEPDSGSPQKKATKKEKRGVIVLAPIPISSPAIGSGLLLGFGYVFPLNRNDKVSPPSTI